LGSWKGCPRKGCDKWLGGQNNTKWENKAAVDAGVEVTKKAEQPVHTEMQERPQLKEPLGRTPKKAVVEHSASPLPRQMWPDLTRYREKS